MITSFTLKVIALVAMTLDHIGKIVGQRGLISLCPALSLLISSKILDFLEFYGRLAFPIFAFLIAESAKKSNNILIYFGRLLLFAIISIPFYSFAFNHDIKNLDTFISCLKTLSFENVLFTFTISIAVIIIFNTSKKYISNKKVFYLISIIISIIGLYIAEFLHTDYGASGVLLVIVLYFAQSFRSISFIIVLWSIVFYSCQLLVGAFYPRQIIHVSFLILGSILSCIPIKFYNGKKGISCKWLFYIYYPVHLFVLSIISAIL